MPALNIIAIQLTVLYSGFSPSRPSGILPYLLTARKMANSTKKVADRMNTQPRLSVIQARRSCVLVFRLSLSSRPQMTNAITAAAVTPKTTRSIRGLGPRTSGVGTASVVSVVNAMNLTRTGFTAIVQLSQPICYPLVTTSFPCARP